MRALIIANLLRRVSRTALTAVGVCIGVTTIVALLSLTGGLNRAAGQLAKLGHADFGVFQGGLSDLTASQLPESVVGHIQKLPGIRSAAGVQIVPNAVAGHSSMLVFGGDNTTFLDQRLVIVAGRPAAGNEAMVGQDGASQLHVAPGGYVTVAGQRFLVSGIYRAGLSFEDQGIILPLSATQRLESFQNTLSMVAVLISPGFKEGDVERTVEQNIHGTVALGAPGEVARVDTNSATIEKAAVVIALLAVLVGAIVVSNTMAMSVMQRLTEFGVLGAVGWGRFEIAQLIVAEGLIVSIVGTTVGLGLGVLAGHALVNALAAGNYVTPDVTTWVLVRGVIVGVGLGVLGAAFSVAQVVRVPLLTALGRG